VSKRSYRRLAVVAGAALAVGSMAPAMAVRVNATGAGTAGAEVETIDVGNVLGSVQSNIALPTNLATNAIGGLQTTVNRATPVLLADIFGLLDNVECVADAGLTATAALNARVLGAVGIGLGGVSLNVAGLAAAPVEVAVGATECLGGLQSDVFTTVGDVRGAANAVGGIATGTARGAVAYAGSLPGAVINTVSPLFLTDLINVRAGANAGALVNIF
jgi:hypothetical protein